jgi:co-chaperonin GroES (HSP10)
MIQAINDKVVAVMLKREKTKSGLIIPDAVQEPQAFCRVLSVGEDVKNIKVGQIIVCHLRGGMDAILDQNIIKVLKNDEIYGVLTDEDTIASLTELELKAAAKKESSRIVQPGHKLTSL